MCVLHLLHLFNIRSKNLSSTVFPRVSDVDTLTDGNLAILEQYVIQIYGTTCLVKNVN